MSGNVRITDMQEKKNGVVGKTMGRAGSLKEGEEGLFVGVSRIIREETVCGRVRQLSLRSQQGNHPHKDDHSNTAPVC